MVYRYQPLYEDPEYYDEDDGYYDQSEEEQEDEYSPYGTSNS